MGTHPQANAPESATVIRIVAGLVFVGAGTAKFAFNDGEVSAFESFHLPLAELFVAAVGVAEILGGLAFVANYLVRPAAALMAAIMLGAIVVSGIGHGDVIPSLTLAPLLLAASLFLSFRRAPR
jgi:putative oxidoreductase